MPDHDTTECAYCVIKGLTWHDEGAQKICLPSTIPPFHFRKTRNPANVGIYGPTILPTFPGFIMAVCKRLKSPRST